MVPKVLKACVVAAAPAAAAAECPGPDALSSGIWVSFPDNWVSQFKATESGTVRETVFDGSDTSFVLEVRDGLHIVSEYTQRSGAVDPKTIKTYVYALPEDGFAAPEPQTSQSIPVTVTRSPEELEKDPAARPSKEVYRVSYGPVGALAIGTCSYVSQIVAIVYEKPGGDGWTSQLNFLPEMGIALLSATGQNGSLYESFHRPIAISSHQPELPKS